MATKTEHLNETLLAYTELAVIDENTTYTDIAELLDNRFASFSVDERISGFYLFFVPSYRAERLLNDINTHPEYLFDENNHLKEDLRDLKHRIYVESEFYYMLSDNCTEPTPFLDRKWHFNTTLEHNPNGYSIISSSFDTLGNTVMNIYKNFKKNVEIYKDCDLRSPVRTITVVDCDGFKLDKVHKTAFHNQPVTILRRDQYEYLIETLKNTKHDIEGYQELAHGIDADATSDIRHIDGVLNMFKSTEED